MCPRHNVGQRSFAVNGPTTTWNSLPPALRATELSQKLRLHKTHQVLDRRAVAPLRVLRDSGDECKYTDLLTYYGTEVFTCTCQHKRTTTSCHQLNARSKKHTHRQTNTHREGGIDRQSFSRHRCPVGDRIARVFHLLSSPPPLLGSARPPPRRYAHTTVETYIFGVFSLRLIAHISAFSISAPDISGNGIKLQCYS